MGKLMEQQKLSAEMSNQYLNLLIESYHTAKKKKNKKRISSLEEEMFSICNDYKVTHKCFIDFLIERTKENPLKQEIFLMMLNTILNRLETEASKKKNEDYDNEGDLVAYLDSTMKTFYAMVLDKNRATEERLALYDILSAVDPKRTFDLTLNLYRNLDTKNTFKGYQKKIHMQQDTEFLLFRDLLRIRVYKYYVQNQVGCKTRLQNLLTEKNLDDKIKEEIVDICKSLKGPESVIRVDLPVEYKARIENVCRKEGISLEELMDKIVDNYLVSNDEKDIWRKIKEMEKKIG
jgi:hypothetical protein